ncbi:putative phosphothreonine lyase domain-containing protein [Legionella tunisiensis]|uniref:putative phosphothreonine lyase domain-containing protein n=1 Tax=Legionella tunisiensis TaxID=1034944 RepID=UPI0012E9F1DA
MDRLWIKIRNAVEIGDLWEAKVSCCKSDQTSDHALLVYCPNSKDLDSVGEVYQKLLLLGIINSNEVIKYKTDAQTIQGIYGSNAYIYTSENFTDLSIKLCK